MIYLLISHVLNGTVTINISSLGIEAKDFEEAKQKVKNLPNFETKAYEITDTKEKLTFNVLQDEGAGVSVYSHLSNVPLEII